MNEDERARMLLAVHTFITSQTCLYLALESCGLDGYTVKRPRGPLHGAADDPWVVADAEGLKVCNFYMEAGEDRLQFKVRSEPGYEYLPTAFERFMIDVLRSDPHMN